MIGGPDQNTGRQLCAFPARENSREKRETKHTLCVNAFSISDHLAARAVDLFFRKIHAEDTNSNQRYRVVPTKNISSTFHHKGSS